MAARFASPLLQGAAALKGKAFSNLLQAACCGAQHSIGQWRLLSSSSAACTSDAGPAPPSTSPLKEQGPFTSKLSERSVIHIDGPDCIHFLQGLVSNDVSHFQSEKPPTSSIPTPNPSQPAAQRPPVYAALLTPQGRFLFDMFLYRPVEAEEKLNKEGTGPGVGATGGLFADVDAETKDELLQTLKR
jgi:folate-binding Fe-S cluster repair protein YgfZ